MDITPIEEVNENENISELLDNAEELVGVVEQDIVIAGVRSINGKAGDLNLKTINNTDLLTSGNMNLQEPLVAGANIQIAQDGKTISATDTTYTAGTGIELTGTEFSIDTDVVATQAELNTKQDKLTQTQLNAVNSGIDETKVAQIATNTGNITSNTNRITTIENKIPSTATSSNKLTDKDYVDNAIATNTANYISDNGQPFQSYADLVAYSGTLTNNDYAFVESHDSAGNDIYTRYKYNADLDLWAEEYTISNPTFTSDQWASINSGVTANDVSQIGTNKSDIATLTTSKQDKLTTAQQSAVDSGIDATKVQQIATNASDITNLQNDKQDKLIAGTNIQIASDGKTISATDTKYTAGTGLTLTGTQFSVTEPVPSGFFTDTQGTQTGEGTAITLNHTPNAPIDNVELKGDTYQNGSPTPDNPVDVQVVTGEQTVKMTGKNLAKVDTRIAVGHGLTWNLNSDGTIIINGTSDAVASVKATADYPIRLKSDQTYVFSANNPAVSGDVTIRLARGNGKTGVFASDVMYSTNRVWTFAGEDTDCSLEIRVASGATLNNYVLRPQLELGSTATAYEPYQGQTFPISLGTTELCGIEKKPDGTYTYQDYIWKDGADWKVHKVTDKVVFNGTSEGTWSMFSNGNAAYLNYPNLPQEIDASSPVTAMVMSNYYRGVLCSAIHTTTPTEDYGLSYYGSSSTRSRFVLRNKDCIDADAIKTWLAAHNTTVYYVLATATDTTITDATLITQLDALLDSTTYAPQTNYNTSTPSPNLPTVLTVDTFKDNYAGLLARLEKAGA